MYGIYVYLESIFDLYFWSDHTPQNKAEIPSKTRDPIWVLGIYIT